ncbi:hypothetical protein M407DRAFT_114394 [Tulasnella calospora MUT 4182]|uniref:MAGE domain-containing protein n=1 Tax=Tulasnella calospora MUT 4182 TaxID=1051891 RepID=A0A0C3Q2X1_9AGAM|nr:hypothetical protein M407DRAFT_114394 [Tulasnella calospora MUT 4182]
MAPRATQASQARRGGPSQSQRRRDGADSEDEDEDYGAMDYDDDEDGEGNMAGASQARTGSQSQADGANRRRAGGTGGLSTEEIKRRANDLVRMALFEEPRRQTIRRADIIKKVLPENSRGFNVVLDTAQRILRHTFGMELVELMTRSDRDAIGEEKKETGKKKSQASGTFILRSTLNPELIKLANKKNDKLYEEEVNSLRALGLIGEEQEDQDYERPGGAILAWKPVEPVALTGILQLVLSLILANGRVLPEPQLKRQLKSFHLYFNTKLPSPAFSSRDEQTLFDHLSDMIKQNYLDRVRVPMPGGAPTGGARRKSRKAADEEEEGLYEWRWGSRAHAEIGEQNVAEFICDFMRKSWLDEQLKLLGEDEEDEERTGAGRRGKNAARNPRRRAEKEAELEDKAEKYGERLLKDVARVAGSELTRV